MQYVHIFFNKYLSLITLSFSHFFLYIFYFVSLFCCVFFFFFQAEDGIRDADVTGVQTCALPISLLQRFPGMTIVVLTNQVIKADLLELSKMGIKHMLCKTIDRDELVMALRFALKGRKFFSEEVLEVLMDEQKRRVLPGEQTQLTQTETEIVKMIAEGMTTKQIAEIGR